MKLPDDVTGELFLQAVREGVCDAVWRMMNHATLTPGGDFREAVKDGVEQAVSQAMATADIEEAIKDGIESSMPFSDRILSAITDGMREAHRD